MSTTSNNLLQPTLEAPAMAFLESLARRDLDGLRGCLAPSARMRALVPPGFREFDGRDAIADKFRAWFGGSQAFELLEAAATTVGARLQLRWRIRLTPRDGTAPLLVEQIAFVQSDSQLTAIDLLCSGFVSERSAAQRN
jgi:SnoaL-like domain